MYLLSVINFTILQFYYLFYNSFFAKRRISEKRVYFKNNYRAIHADRQLDLFNLGSFGKNIEVAQRHQDLFGNKAASAFATIAPCSVKLHRDIHGGKFRGKPNSRDTLARFLR